MAARKSRFEGRPRPDGLWDVYLVARNGELQQFSNQGFEKRNVRRAVAAIKRSVAEATFIFVKE